MKPGPRYTPLVECLPATVPFIGPEAQERTRGRPFKARLGAMELQDLASLDEQFELYARSAELGNAVAQYNIAMMYSNGEAVNVDYQQAAYWFRESAAQNFAPALYRLGEMHYFGRGGLAVDLDKAIELFEQAARRGDSDAQMNLAMLLGSGEGVPLDTARALHWMQEADGNGHPAAVEYREMLAASPGGRFSDETRRAYWEQQQTFWIDKAAEYGVREAEEAVAPGDGAGESGSSG